jgi:hypothetical protein
LGLKINIAFVQNEFDKAHLEEEMHRIASRVVENVYWLPV